MLDFGWAELLILVAVAVFVIGPKDIPNVMYGLGRLVRRFQYIKYAVSQQFDDIMNTGDLEELRKGVNFEQRRTSSDIQTERDEDESDIEEIQLQENYPETINETTKDEPLKNE